MRARVRAAKPLVAELSGQEVAVVQASPAGLKPAAPPRPASQPMLTHRRCARILTAVHRGVDHGEAGAAEGGRRRAALGAAQQQPHGRHKSGAELPIELPAWKARAESVLADVLQDGGSRL